MPRESNAKNYSFTSWETDPFTRALETDALADVWRKLVPAEWTLMLGATSKRIRAALARLPMHVRLPAVVQFPKPWERQGDKDRKTVEAISCGLPRLQEWCLITTLNLALCRIGDQGIAGVKMLSKALGGTPFTHPSKDLNSNYIGAEGAGFLVAALQQVASVAYLGLGWNKMGRKVQPS
jgi:hypothetical protein